MRKDLHEENRLSWNAATEAHNSHKGDQAKFFREGGDTLFPEELALLRDIRGARLVHLQCNSGQDTLSLARRGAVVTGIDISDAAIAFARRLSQESGISATFVRADVIDWLAETAAGSTRYDVAFCSYGALVWLSDLEPWAQGIAGILKPGGRFVLVEFHPFAMALDEHYRLAYPYFTEGEPSSWEEGVGDYVAAETSDSTPWDYEPGVEAFVNPHRAHEFAWGIGQVVTALLSAGLTLTALEEYSYMNAFKPYIHMQEVPGRRLYPAQGIPRIPLMFGIAATK